MKWTFYPVLLNVSSRTCLPIFIEIGSYLTNTEQKTVGTFFETRCIAITRPYGTNMPIHQTHR